MTEMKRRFEKMTEKCPVGKGQKKRWVTCVRDRRIEGALSVVEDRVGGPMGN